MMMHINFSERYILFYASATTYKESLVAPATNVVEKGLRLHVELNVSTIVYRSDSQQRLGSEL